MTMTVGHPLTYKGKDYVLKPMTVHDRAQLSDCAGCVFKEYGRMLRTATVARCSGPPAARRACRYRVCHVWKEVPVKETADG